MCIECCYLAKIGKIMKDESLANYEQLEEIFKLKEYYEKGLDLDDIKEREGVKR